MPIIEKETFKYSLNEVRTSLFVLFVWEIRTFRFADYKTEERLISLLFTTASERYRELLKDNPDLLQRMPLECLASYLGITPVSLSRIRAKLKREH